MAVQMPPLWPLQSSSRLRRGENLAGTRLGIDLPAGWWPATPRLKSYEAAGFQLLHVRMPPRAQLCDERFRGVHAGAVRESLKLTGLELILHAPDELLAGTREHDRQLESALRYAALAGAEVIVYHGARVPIDEPGVRARLATEARSLRRLAELGEELGVRIAIENLAPVYSGREYACHNPAAVAELVGSVDRDSVGICLDVGHAHIAAGLSGADLVEAIWPALERAILIELHDNFGARADAPRAGGIEPLRLDLHLAPGAGSIPWAELAPLLAGHPAPMQLEVHPAQRPEPATLAIVMRELLGRALSAR